MIITTPPTYDLNYYNLDASRQDVDMVCDQLASVRQQEQQFLVGHIPDNLREQEASLYAELDASIARELRARILQSPNDTSSVQDEINRIDQVSPKDHLYASMVSPGESVNAENERLFLTSLAKQQGYDLNDAAQRKSFLDGVNIWNDSQWKTIDMNSIDPASAGNSKSVEGIYSFSGNIQLQGDLLESAKQYIYIGDDGKLHDANEWILDSRELDQVKMDESPEPASMKKQFIADYADLKKQVAPYVQAKEQYDLWNQSWHLPWEKGPAAPVNKLAGNAMIFYRDASMKGTLDYLKTQGISVPAQLRLAVLAKRVDESSIK